MEPFRSVVDERVHSSVKVTVYCTCRLPHNPKEKMAQCCKCDEWSVKPVKILFQMSPRRRLSLCVVIVPRFVHVVVILYQVALY